MEVRCITSGYFPLKLIWLMAESQQFPPLYINLGLGLEPHQPKIIAHFLHSVKWLKTRSLGRTVCFADQVTQLSDIPSIPSTPDYVPVHDCPHCCKSVLRSRTWPPNRNVSSDAVHNRDPSLSSWVRPWRLGASCWKKCLLDFTICSIYLPSARQQRIFNVYQDQYIN